MFTTQILLSAALVPILVVVFTKYRQSQLVSDLPGSEVPLSLLGIETEIMKSTDEGDNFVVAHRKYGTTYSFPSCFWTRTLVVSDPRSLQYILHTAAYAYKRPEDVRFFHILTSGNGLIFAEGKSHQRQRKILNPAFSAAQLKQFLALFQRSTSRLLESLDDHVSKGNSRVDIAQWATKIALDAVGESTFSHQFRAIDGKSDHIIDSVRGSFGVFRQYSTLTILNRALRRHIPLSLSLSIPSQDRDSLKGAKSAGQEVAEEMFAKYKQIDLSGIEAKDILHVLMRSNQAEEPAKRMSDEEVIAQTSTIIQAGHHTVGSLLSWICYELAKNPRDQERISEEIKVFRAQHGEDAEFTAKDYDKMTYLNAVIQETLRFHPTVSVTIREATHDDYIPLAMPVVSPSTGEIITQVAVKRGQRILIDIANYHRLESVWGSAAGVWNPSRFLDASLKGNQLRLGVLANANILTFSGGVRGCIGWRFALMEAQTIMVGLLEHFEIALPPEGDQIAGVRVGLLFPMVKGKLEEGTQVPVVIRKRK